MIEVKIVRCMGCGMYNPKLEVRSPEDDEDGLYVCKECGNNAFEFYHR